MIIRLIVFKVLSLSDVNERYAKSQCPSAIRPISTKNINQFKYKIIKKNENFYCFVKIKLFIQFIVDKSIKPLGDSG